MRRPLPQEDQVLSVGWGLTGVILTAGAALSADLAWAHSQALGVLCGASSSPHCGWCFGAAGLAIAGLAASAAAVGHGRNSGLLEIKAR
jgi:hypothetical protein